MVNIRLEKDFSYRLQAGQKTHRRPVLKGFVLQYRVLQTIQMKMIFLCVWAEPAVLGSAKTALKFKYEI